MGVGGGDAVVDGAGAFNLHHAALGVIGEGHRLGGLGDAAKCEAGCGDQDGAGDANGCLHLGLD